MRIVVSGATSMGKSTLVQDFLAEWPNYTEGKLSFRDTIRDKLGVDINSPDIMRIIRLGSKANQEYIRDSIIDDISKYSRTDNVIFDRGLMDNLMYSLYLCGVSVDGCNGSWMKEQLPILQESFKHYDIIFYIPLLVGYETPMIPDGSLELDREVIFRSECDNIYKALQKEYIDGKRIWLPKENTPALIEVFGTPQERIQMIKLYIDGTGSAYGENNSLITSHLKEGIELLEELEKTNTKRKN